MVISLNSLNCGGPSALNIYIKNKQPSNYIYLSQLHALPDSSPSSSVCKALFRVALRWVRSGFNKPCDDVQTLISDCYVDRVSKVVPLIASRASLPPPGTGGTVPLDKILNEDDYFIFARPENGLIADIPEAVINSISAVKGISHKEYIKLLKRMEGEQVEFQDYPPKIQNGLFGVTKSEEKDRIIDDDRRANIAFIDPPHADLPNPSFFADLVLPKNKELSVSVSDADNFYHRILLPPWIRQYLGLWPVQSSELELPGKNRLIYPIRRTLPMGWKFSVYISCLVGKNTINNCGFDRPFSTIQDCDTLSLDIPKISNYVDDTGVLSTSDKCSNDMIDQYVKSSTDSGIPENVAKRKKASESTESVAMLGIEFHRSGLLLPSKEKFSKTLAITHALCLSRCCSSNKLSQIIGSWVWICMMKRPILSILYHCYQFIEKKHETKTRLPGTVIAELTCLLGIAPLISADISIPISNMVVATDSSSKGAGVVYKWCSKKALDLLANIRAKGDAYTTLKECSLQNETVPEWVDSQWKTAQAFKWKYSDHINILEGHAILCALRWLSRFQKYINSRMVFLCDSAVMVGALSKGRSSCRRILHLCRRIASYLLLLNIKPYWVWIPTQFNPADEPSRRY